MTTGETPQGSDQRPATFSELLLVRDDLKSDIRILMAWLALLSGGLLAILVRLFS